jgi:formylglycine-generating enzyme required for sulfatase activity
MIISGRNIMPVSQKTILRAQKNRIFQGGSWNDSNVDYLSTSFIYLKKPGYKNSTVGFRLAIQI